MTKKDKIELKSKEIYSYDVYKQEVLNKANESFKVNLPHTYRTLLDREFIYQLKGLLE